MYSCATTKETREDQLQMLLDGETNGEVLKENCPRDQGGAERQPLMMLHSVPGPSKRRLTHLPSRLLPEYRNDETSTQTSTDLPQRESESSVGRAVLCCLMELCCVVLWSVLALCCVVLCYVMKCYNAVLCRGAVLSCYGAL